MAGALSSDQVNYLIWRYLQEQGYGSTATEFQNESRANAYDHIFAKKVREGHLVYLVQRGLHWEELRSKDQTIKGQPMQFMFLPPAPALDLGEDEAVATENGVDDEDEDMDGDADDEEMEDVDKPSPKRKLSLEDGQPNGTKSKKRKRDKSSAPNEESMVEAMPPSPALTDEPRPVGKSTGTQAENAASEVVKVVKKEDITVVSSESGTSVCAWNPTSPDVLATAALSSVIMRVPLDVDRGGHGIIMQAINHGPSKTPEGSRVYSMQWSPQGDRLATGTHDGRIRVWSIDGILDFSSAIRTSPIVTLKWNSAGTTLIMMSASGRVTSWEVEKPDDKSFYNTEAERATDIDWIADTNEFLVGGEQGGVYRFAVGQRGSLQKAVVKGELACIRWDKITSSFVTGGESSVITIWRKETQSLPQNNFVQAGRLAGHTGTITSLEWQPSSSSPRILASAAEDKTVRIWDTEAKTQIHKLMQQGNPIERIVFSPDGAHLASGASGEVVVYRVETGRPTHAWNVAKTRRGRGKVNGVKVNGDEVAAEEEEAGLGWDKSGGRLVASGWNLGTSILRFSATSLR